MIRARVGRAASMASALAVAGSAACDSSPSPQPRPSAGASNVHAEADLIRRTERERVRALVEANVKRARQLHADDFQLINPLGGPRCKDAGT